MVFFMNNKLHKNVILIDFYLEYIPHNKIIIIFSHRNLKTKSLKLFNRNMYDLQVWLQISNSY